jgi:hypothetical protein
MKLNERKLTKAEVSKREDIIMDMKKNKRELTKRYGKDAEKVMYGRATNLAKKQLENMDPKSKLREMIKTALSSTNEEFTKKYDNHPTLKGGQKNLPDALQKPIIDNSEVKEDKTPTPPPISLVNKRRAKADMKQFTTGKRADKGVVNKADGTKDDKYNSIILGVEKNGNQTQLKTLDDFNSKYVEYYLADSNYKTNSYKIPKYQNVKEDFRVEYETKEGEIAKSGIYKTKEEAEKKEAELVDKSRIKQAKIVNVDSGLKEDLDLGHQDDEPHMLKANLYRIGKYAMELYQMMDKFEGQGEVDLPHWWQSKIIKSESMITSAKHYLDFELKEPEIDGMVDVASEEEIIGEDQLNEIESGDIVSYEGEDHTVMRIADDFLGKRIYIRPNEEAVFGGKKDTFWVKPEDLNEKLTNNKPSQDEVDKFFSDTQNEMHYLASKPVMGQKGDRVRSEIEPWDEYDLSNWNALVKKAKIAGKIAEMIKGAHSIMGDKSKKKKRPSKKDIKLAKDTQADYKKEEEEDYEGLAARSGASLEEIDMNDPALIQVRARKIADEKEKAKQSALDKKYGSSFMDKLDAEIDLKNELSDLKDERKQLMIDMEQEAEPEGGEIADDYGSRLNDIDSRINLIQKDIDDLRMYESLNEDKYYITRNLGKGQGMALVKDVENGKVIDRPKEFKSYNDAQKEADRLEKGDRNMTSYFVSDKDMKLSSKLNESNEEVLSILKTKDDKFVIGMAAGKYPRSIETKAFDTQQDACRFFGDNEKVILRDLTENKIDESTANEYEVLGDVYSTCTLDETKKPKTSTIAEKLAKQLKSTVEEDMGEWPKELTSRYSDEYRFELEKITPTYKDKPGRALYKVIDIESGELKATPAFGKPEHLMAYADDLIKPQGGTRSTNLGESLKTKEELEAAKAKLEAAIEDAERKIEKHAKSLAKIDNAPGGGNWSSSSAEGKKERKLKDAQGKLRDKIDTYTKKLKKLK